MRDRGTHPHPAAPGGRCRRTLGGAGGDLSLFGVGAPWPLCTRLHQQQPAMLSTMFGGW